MFVVSKRAVLILESGLIGDDLSDKIADFQPVYFTLSPRHVF